jgi:hypothetical protein
VKQHVVDVKMKNGATHTRASSHGESVTSRNVSGLGRISRVHDDKGEKEVAEVEEKDIPFAKCAHTYSWFNMFPNS